MGHNEYNVVALHPCRAPLDLTGWPKKTSGRVVDDVVAVLADCKAFSVGEKHVSKHTKSCELNVVKSCVRSCAIIENHVKNCEIMSDSSEIIRHHVWFPLKYNKIMWNPVIPGMWGPKSPGCRLLEGAGLRGDNSWMRDRRIVSGLCNIGVS